MQVREAGVEPWLVLAIDRPLHSYLDEKGVPNFFIEQEIAAVQQVRKLLAPHTTILPRGYNLCIEVAERRRALA